MLSTGVQIGNCFLQCQTSDFCLAMEEECPVSVLHTISIWWWTVWLFSYFCSQIRSPKLEEHNGFWPTDSFTPSSRLSETIAACLSQPFKFEYTEGRVGSIFAPEDCPVLCTNLARGVLNMLQITIKKTQNVYELQEVCCSILILLLVSFQIKE